MLKLYLLVFIKTLKLNYLQLFNTPILFIVFNRPKPTKKVLDMLSSIKPKQLFISADGPRKKNENDIKNMEKSAMTDDRDAYRLTVVAIIAVTDFKDRYQAMHIYEPSKELHRY